MEIKNLKLALKGDDTAAENFIAEIKEQIESGKVSRQTMLDMRQEIIKSENIDPVSLMYWTKFEFYLSKRL